MKRLLQLVVAVVLLAVVLRTVNWSAFLDVVRGVRVEWLGVMFLVGTADRLWMAGKWRYLLHGLGVPASWRDTVYAYYAGGLVGQAAQWQLGGDVARAAQLSRASGRGEVVAASVVLEKVIGFSAAGLVALGALVLLEARYAVVRPPELLLLLVPIGALVLLAPLALLLTGGRRSRRALEWMARRLRRPPPATTARLRRTLVGFFFLTLAEQGLALLAIVVLARALRLELDVWALVAVAPIVLFLARLPVSIESLGSYEALSLLLFGLVGLAPAAAVALALVDRVMGLLVTGAGTLALVTLGVPRRVPSPTATSLPPRPT